MDTDTLMSSLREMITADIKLQMAFDRADKDEADLLGEQYSRHETVVREQLQKLGDEASSFKPDTRRVRLF